MSGAADVATGRVSRRPAAGSDTHGVVRDSVVGSAWTVVSRATGLGQTVTVGAILGATYLGNTYLALNSIPNLLYYQLLAGSLFASLLVPPLLARADAEDHEGAERLARGFYGVILLAAACLACLLLVASPVLLRIFTAPVADESVAAAQRHAGLVFLVLFVPQIALYATAGTGAAVLNAHGRFALPAGGPALENLAMIATLILAGILFGTHTPIEDVATAELLLLGLGTTAGVGAHAASQWLGAKRVGVTLRPRIGWRDPDVRAVLRRIVPTLGFTGLAALQTGAVLVLANAVPGGLVAFQLAMSFFFLPVAVIVWPIARSLLPRLARLGRDGASDRFGGELTRGTSLATLVIAPAAVAYVVLALPIARAIAFGALRSGAGIELVAVSLAALGLGVLAESWFVLGTYAFYAVEDVRSPVRSMVIRAGVAIPVMLASLLVHGAAVLLVLGVGMTAGTSAGAIHAWRSLSRRYGVRPPVRELLGKLAASCVMAVPAGATAWLLARWLPASHLRDIAIVVASGAIGLATYVAIQAARRSPELAAFRTFAATRGGRGGVDGEPA